MKKKKLNSLLIITMLITLLGGVQSSATDYIMGTRYYPIPNLPKPTKGVWFEDPNFKTKIVRVTDRVIDNINRNPFVMIPEYSRSSPENADGSLLLLTYMEGNLYLYDAKTFQYIKCLSQYHGGKIPINLDGGPEARWDSSNPDIFYYVYAMGFYQYNVRTDQITLLHDFSVDFPDGWLIQNDGEGEPSMDCRYWAFSVRGEPPKYPNWDKFAIVTYDLQEDRIIGKIDDMRKLGFPAKYWFHNTVSISPFGDRVLVEWDEGYEGFPSVSYALDFSDPIQLGRDGHSDMAIDADGNQVHVIKDDQYDWIVMIDMLNGKRTNLVKLPLADSWDDEPSIHISGNNYLKPGWVVISTSWGNKNSWPHYQVFMLELKENPRIWRIAHTHGVWQQDYYWTETKATINDKGTKIWWGSNWGLLDVDTYQTTLPPTWWEDFGGVQSIELISFQASLKEKTVLLDWRISSSSTVQRFEIERSRDGKKYHKIGSIKFHANSPKYHFIDDRINQGTYFYRLKMFENTNVFKYSDPIEISVMLPNEFNLEQNYPNPFNPATVVGYTLPRPANIHLAIYDSLGRFIVTLVEGKQHAGQKTVVWNGVDANGVHVKSGLYFCRLQIDKSTITKKMLLIR